MNTNVTRSLDTKPQYKKDRFLYILQATIESFITIAVGTTYLAKVALSIGMSDATIALLTQVLHFTRAFQLLSIPLNKFKHPKHWLTPMLLVIEISFTLIYLIPVFPIPTGARPALLVIAVVLGNTLYNISCSPKAAWMIGFVADDRRGKFTAVMQTISLGSGMAFSYVLGKIIDTYEMRGDMRGVFVVSGLLVASMSVLHVIIFLCTKEIPNEGFVNVSVRDQVRSVVKNKSLMRILPVYALYFIAYLSATPFYSTYQIKELGFSMTYIAILSAVSAATCSIASIFFGRLGDKRGFLTMLNLAYLILAAAFLVNVFTAPANGTVLYALYVLLHAIACGGTGVADNNLIYEYAPLDARVGAMAIRGTASGIVSFLWTLLMSGLVSRIQENGNRFLGMGIYAQQVVSAIAFIFTLVLILYVNTVAKGAKRCTDGQSESKTAP